MKITLGHTSFIVFLFLALAWRAGQNSNFGGIIMKRFLVAAVLLGLPGVAFAQSKSVKDQLVGAWTLVAVTSEMDDGSKGEPFGPSAKGIIIFSGDGHFSLFQSRADLPKIAANDRAKAVPEEAQAIVANSIAYYGNYTVDEGTKEMVVNLAASTYPNVAAIPNQKRMITVLTSDVLEFDNPRTPNGMTLRTVWKRAAAN
jgi:Lipocalin-like domain